MRSLILADIHANLEAFHAVLNDAHSRGTIDQLWSLGDIVGYGPNPTEVIDLLRDYDHVSVAGNHDWAAIGKIDTRDFNPYAKAAAQWTQTHLSKEHTDYLASLPLILERGDFTLVHGTPRDPIWEYLVSDTSALASLEHLKTGHCLVGHSHIPFFCRVDPDALTCEFLEFPTNVPIELDKGPLFINPGGVGQPRDRNPTSNYAIYDSDLNSICHYRVPYDIPATQEKMRRANLPEPLITRLSRGV